MHKPALLLVTSFLGLSGCANLTNEGSDPSPQPAKTTTSETAQITPAATPYGDFEPETLYLLLSAEIAAQRGRYDVTLVNYVEAAKQSQDAAVIERAMRIAQSLKADNAQRQLANLWLETHPDSIEAHRVAAIQSVKRNELESALSHMERILELGGDADFDSLAAMAANLTADGQLELLSLYEGLAQRHPDNLEIQYSIALLFKVLGDNASALEALQPILDNQPEFQPALVLKGDLLYQLGRKDEALKHLLYNTRHYPQNRQMGTLYGRMLIGEGQMQAAQDEFQRLVTQFPDVPGLRLSHALVALENGEKELAKQGLTQLIEQGHHVSEAHYYLGRIADEDGDSDTAIGYYDRVDDGNHYLAALARASTLRAEAGNLDQARANILRLRNTHPDRAESYWLLEINLLLDMDMPDQALEVSNTAITAYPDNVRIRYARAMLLDSEDQFDAAEQDLRRIIEQEPDNAVALNALGYILTTRQGRLDEARLLIERALEIDPENPAILDSMGWVLFQLGESTQALEYLRAAYEAFPDPEVAAHYGEALWQNGQREQARIIWREGLEQAPSDELIIETIERLGAGQDL
ncbi:tetratricopeptide repeat protein [Marinobacter caseinilyticus]|uniref:tetratricopeptide repeat protein n=1 Tax=Marinobacter caseinilyticus TaxID=2692195 RepID=UPI00140B44D9|nr:tetratricopeptide repeat protein [Marinobacter caseinilyticus]